ncbi:MAG: hypothetical protein A2219_01295 [Elusimicrobia bacterium RIFOXYA2_FULL_50_26]|nr:MAG: hypothetical protein A2219_01295 [Elusimicrobia bacterium RIFOXYA2_FULL_50_26]OGS24291.1 MAG: hypothetical protein A2314_07535 [Elusimicrobia bacterium RIFOXYB2_FULL_50_12]
MASTVIKLANRPFIVIVGLIFFSSLGFLFTLKEYLLISLFSLIIVLPLWHYPEAVILGIIACAPINRSIRNEFISVDTIIHVKYALIYIAGAVWCVKRLRLPTPAPLPLWSRIFLMCWFSLTLLAAIHSINISETIQYMFFVISGFLLFYIFLHLDAVWHKRTAVLIVCVAGVVAFLSVIEFLCATYGFFPSLNKYIISPGTQYYLSLAPDIRRLSTIYRSMGTFTHPNILGIYLAMVAPFAGALIKAKEIGKHMQYVMRISLVLIIAGIFVTNSRAGILACAVGLLYLSVHKGYRHWITIILFTGFIVGSLYFGIPDAFMQQFDKVSRKQHGLSGRAEIWKNGLENIRQSPWLGVGPGNATQNTIEHNGYFIYDNIGEEYEQMNSINKTGEDIKFSFHMHNIYLQLMSEAGVFAPLLYLAGILLLIIHCERRAGILQSFSMERGLALAVASAAVGFIVYGFFDSQLPFTRLTLNFVAAPLLAAALRV